MWIRSIGDRLVVVGQACVSGSRCVNTAKGTILVNSPLRRIERVEMNCLGCKQAQEYANVVSDKLRSAPLQALEDEKWTTLMPPNDHVCCRETVHKLVSTIWNNCWKKT